MRSRRDVLATLVASALLGQNQTKNMFGDAAAYEKFMGRWSRMLAPLLVNFTDVPDRGQALDVGSGTGALAFSIAALKTHCHIVGVDPSKEYVGYADSQNRFRGRVSFQVGDAQQLTFQDASFDNSLSLLVFNFIPDRPKALGEVIRVTKPGGCVSAAVWDYGKGMRMLRVFFDSVREIDASADRFDEAHMPLSRGGELGDLWRQGSLERVTERPLDITMRFASFADYWEPFLLGQGPAGTYVQKLDGDRKQALRDEVKRRLALSNDDAPFSLPARAWAVRGFVRQR